MMILAVLFTLAFTAPAANTQAYECYRHHQAPSWARYGPSYRRVYDAGARTWPDSLVTAWATIAREADWELVGEFAGSPFDAGQTITITVPDGAGWEYGIITRGLSGERSAMSNQVAR
jgi:hypothetical protein